ncbi:MAG: GYD domain-containing protein [Acidobacteriaceae bacterium]|nr:GYD domain-containing protein [Acidobacteriaceae bacterium]MBV9222725.1 GYD domain-containing protein [Acidobacteriaceae bacterium]MBV9676897.1 GYD domain-containing protein [Acidobacteriaceae bacterium]
MAHYLLQLSYMPEAWATLVRNPQDRAEAVRGPIENLGGKMERVWMAFGEDDVVAIIDMPDNIAAAAIAIAFSAGGACKNVKTTPLLSIQEGMEAMKRAAQCGYRPVHKAASA